MTTCQSKMKSVEHSNPQTDPEMFTVFSKGKPTATSTQCLAHAQVAEAKGYRVEIILT